MDKNKREVSRFINIIKGDLVSDGIIDSKDIDKFRGYLNNNYKLKDYEEKSMDITDDGSIDINDLNLLENAINDGMKDFYIKEEKIVLQVGEESRIIGRVLPGYGVNMNLVYINNNESSHFNPVRDFLKICKHMLKYTIPTLLTLIVDILAFIQVFLFYRYLEVETTFNLLISGFVGYFVSFIVHMVLTSQGVFYGNTNIFKNKTRKRRYILFGLVAVLLNTSLIIGSYYLVNNVAGAKAIADGVFVVSYLLFNYFIVPKTMLH